MKCAPLPLIVLGAGLFAAHASSAATLTLAGTIVGTSGTNNDQIDQWRTTTVVKTLDADGDNVYGTAGYVTFATDTVGNGNAGQVAPADPLTFVGGTEKTLSLVPSYLTLTSAGQNQIAASYGYRQIDDPTQTPGSSVSDVESGAALASAALGTEVSFMKFTIGSGFPTAGLRLGLLLGNTDNFQGTFRLTQTGGGSATLSVPENYATSSDLEMAFIDISGVAVGDEFTLYGVKAAPQPSGGSTNANVLFGGLTFDKLQSVPEPSGTLLAMAGGAAALGWRRRKSAVR